jgi:hypothetical protein
MKNQFYKNEFLKFRNSMVSNKQVRPPMQRIIVVDVVTSRVAALFN